jgi:hypothetical protein
MDVPVQPADKQTLPQQPGRPWYRWLLRGVVAGLLLAFAGETSQVYFLGNFHTVEPGKFYRCSQPSPAHLRRLIKDHGIRTVVNLRGCCSDYRWYRDECRVSADLDVCQEDLCFSAGRLPSVAEIRRLVEILDHSALPLLFHCHRGADRTGLASTVALLLHSDLPYETARRQLGPRYGHVAIGRTANLDRFFDLYCEWLDHEGLSHSRQNFRRWIEQDYCPGECRAEIEALDLPRTVPAGEPFAACIRVRNTSIKPWQLRPGVTSGVHAAGVLINSRGETWGISRAGLFDAVVPPGESIELTLPVRAPEHSGRYQLILDMIDERHCTFFQTGSEPLEWDIEVRGK